MKYIIDEKELEDLVYGDIDLSKITKFKESHYPVEVLASGKLEVIQNDMTIIPYGKEERIYPYKFKLNSDIFKIESKLIEDDRYPIIKHLDGKTFKIIVMDNEVSK